MKKTKFWALLSAAVISITFSASMVYGAGYGMAGCGLGSVIIGPKGGILQIFAATSNNTVTYTQLFGITSGTSNCSEKAGAFQQKQQEIFVSVNMNSLEQEMAMGKGEKLNAFAGLLGCPANQNSAFAKMAQAQYKNLAAKTEKLTPSDLLAAVKSNISKDAQLAASCRI